MSASKGNELLQELCARLKNLWEKGQPFPIEDVKDLVKRIYKEYETDGRER